MKISHNCSEDLLSSSKSKSKETKPNVVKTVKSYKTYSKKLTTKKAKNSNFKEIQQLFKSTSYAITELLDDPIDAEEIDQFTEKFCIDHVKCVKVSLSILCPFQLMQQQVMMWSFNILCEPLGNIHG